MKTLFLFFFFLFSFNFPITYAQSNWLWGKCGKGSGLGVCVATDKQGNGYLSGFFLSEDTLDFYGNILIDTHYNPNGGSTFIAKFSNTGGILWAEQSINYGNNLFGNGSGITVSKSGNVYINATYIDTAIIGPDTLNFPCSFTSNYYLAEYAPDGHPLWAKSPKLNTVDTSGIASNYISADNRGNIFVTGIFNADTVHFGGIPMYGNRHVSHSFLVKYDSNGNVLWTSSPPVTSTYILNETEGLGVANDKWGNTYLTGDFEDTVWFGATRLITIPPMYAGDFFLAKYAANGNILWAKQAIIPSTYSRSLGYAVTTDSSGNIYVAGDFLDTVSFGAFTLIAKQVYYPQQNIFLVKYDSAGNVMWAKKGTPLDSNGWGVGGISSDNHNHIYLSVGGGDGNSKIVFAGDTLSTDDTARYDAAAIIYKLDSNGNVLCSSVTPGGGYQFNSIASDTSGNYVYFGGTAQTDIFFGADTVSPFWTGAPPFIARWEECDMSLGINNIVNKNITWTRVYPNPNNGSFTLSLSNINTGCNMEIYNVLGEKVYTETLKQNQRNNIINMTDKPNGVYLYRVISEDGNLVGEGKVLVQK